MSLALKSAEDSRLHQRTAYWGNEDWAEIEREILPGSMTRAYLLHKDGNPGYNDPYEAGITEFIRIWPNEEQNLSLKEQWMSGWQDRISKLPSPKVFWEKLPTENFLG